MATETLRLLDKVPEKWREVTYDNITDQQVEEMVEDINARGKNISLSVPYTALTVAAFFGLFKCQRCGDCCKGKGDGDIGGIALLPNEVKALAELRGVSRRKFKDEHTYLRGNERLMEYPCLFYDSVEHSCTIYSNRPIVCRLYPLAPPYCDPSLPLQPLLSICGDCKEAKRLAIKIIQLQVGSLPKRGGY